MDSWRQYARPEQKTSFCFCHIYIAGGLQDFLTHRNYFTNQIEFVFDKNIDYLPKWLVLISHPAEDPQTASELVEAFQELGGVLCLWNK